MYGTLINGILRLAPKKVIYEDKLIFNPPDAVYEALGYYPVIYTDAPEAEEGYMPVSHWEEQDGAIVQVWEIEEDPYYYEATPDEIAEALEGIL